MTDHGAATDPAELDATAQAALVRAGEASPRELVEAAIERIERLDPAVNAVIHRRFAAARAEADAELPDGPFRGVPLCLKDVLAFADGEPYHLGMRFLRDRDHRGTGDAEIVRRFRAAGFVVVGRTNAPELASSDTTEPVAYGATHNPWALDRSPGGSSGGSAAAVAARMVPVAHGNDMGGSIRVPASACGLVGLKPSRGRTSLAPAFGEFWGPTTHEGVVTRTVRDTAAVLDAIAGPAPGDPVVAPPPARPWHAEVGADPGRLRIGVADVAGVHPSVAGAVATTAALLASLGHAVSDDAPPFETLPAEALMIFPVFVARDLERWSEIVGEPIAEDDVEPPNRLLARIGREVPATRYLAALEQIHAWARRVAAWWAGDHDLLLLPTMPEPPIPLGDDGMDLGTRLTRFTIPWNLTGQPAISLPVTVDAAGLPIGVQLVAAYGREDLLISTAAQLESEIRWQQRRPPILDS